jgi:hypothetical protein
MMSVSILLRTGVSCELKPLSYRRRESAHASYPPGTARRIRNTGEHLMAVSKAACCGS